MNDLKGIIEDCNKSDLVSDKVIKKIIEIIGQEEWNNIYDEESDICTTMGELIITLKYIADLEKENAELKEKYVKNITDCDICDTYCNSQLTTAKKIISEYIDILKGDTKNWKKTQEKAEQFISEVKNV